MCAYLHTCRLCYKYGNRIRTLLSSSQSIDKSSLHSLSVPLARQGCFPGCLRIIQWRFHMTNEVAYRWLDHCAPCAGTSIHTKRSSIDYISCTGNKNGRHLARDHPQESSSSLLADCIIKFSIVHLIIPVYYCGSYIRIVMELIVDSHLSLDSSKHHLFLTHPALTLPQSMITSRISQYPTTLPLQPFFYQTNSDDGGT